MVINKISKSIFIILLLTIAHTSYYDIKTLNIKEYKSDDTGMYDSYIYGLDRGREWTSDYY